MKDLSSHTQGYRQHHNALDNQKHGFNLEVPKGVLFRDRLVKQRGEVQQQGDKHQLRCIIHRIGQGGLGMAVYGKDEFRNGKYKS